MQINKRLRSCFFVLILLFSLTAYAQNIIPRFEHFGVNEGLPHSSVYNIIQDKRGFMWFGTPDGLCRYDGSVLVGYKYNSQSPDDVINNFVRGKLFEVKTGNIWYSNESGIYKWDVYQEKIEKVRTFKKNEFGNLAFHAVYFDNAGSLWLLNIVSGVFKFDIVTGKLTQYPLPPTKSNISVILSYHNVDATGNL